MRTKRDRFVRARLKPVCRLHQNTIMVRLQDHAKILVTEEISTKLPISEVELALMILNSRVNDCVVSSLENLPDFQGVLDGLILHPHTVEKL